MHGCKVGCGGDIRRSGTTTSRLGKDHLDSNHIVTDSGGALAAGGRIAHGPFGKSQGTPPVSNAYINERYDAETGFQYLHNVGKLTESVEGAFTERYDYDAAARSLSTKTFNRLLKMRHRSG